VGDGDDGENGRDERVEAPEVPQTLAADARAARHRELTVLFSVDLIRKGVCSIFEDLHFEGKISSSRGKDGKLPIYYCVSLRMRVGFLLLLLLLLLLQILPCGFFSMYTRYYTYTLLLRR